jgi:hypothetical protein
VGIDAADFDHAFGDTILGVPAFFFVTKRPKNQTRPEAQSCAPGLLFSHDLRHGITGGAPRSLG